MRSQATSAVYAMALLACGSNPSLAVLDPALLNGSRDSRHPAVGAIAIKVSSNEVQFVCTGTLVGSESVLTAAHCVHPRDGSGNPLPCSTPQSDWPTLTECDATTDFLIYSDLMFLVHCGDVSTCPLQINSNLFAGADPPSVHDSYAPQTARFDLALIKLERPPAVAPLLVRREAPATGTPLTLVGFGWSSATANDYGIKRQATAGVATADGTKPWFAVDGASSSSGSPCFGDSGGPALSGDGAERVVGVVSGSTTPVCGQGQAYYSTIDIGWLTAASSGDALTESWDTQAPVVEIVSPVADRIFATTLNSKLPLTVVATIRDDSATEIDLRVNGMLGPSLLNEGQAADTYSADVLLSPGPNELRVIATDDAGNVGQDIVTIQVKVPTTDDVTPPDISILAPAIGDKLPSLQPVQVIGRASDDRGVANVALSIDGTMSESPAEQQDNRYIFEIQLAPGEHQLTLTAVDATGNAASASVSMTSTSGDGAGTPQPRNLPIPTGEESNPNSDSSSGCRIVQRHSCRPCWLLAVLLLMRRRRRDRASSTPVFSPTTPSIAARSISGCATLPLNGAS